MSEGTPESEEIDPQRELLAQELGVGADATDDEILKAFESEDTDGQAELEARYAPVLGPILGEEN